MIECNSTVETERKEGIPPRLASDGVYFTRFDSYETENELVFRTRMPDVELIQVETRRHNGDLLIQGKVRLASDAATGRGHSTPLCFFRSFPISREVLVERASDTFKDGVLTVRLPKHV